MLPYVGNIDDIALLTMIARQNEEGIAAWAAISLDNLHLQEAINALEKLEKEVVAPKLKKVLNDLLEPYRSGRNIPTRLCSAN
jgi:hypothetical protein